MIRTEDYLREFILIFFSQRQIILWTTAIVFVLSMVIALFWPPTYLVNGSVLVKAKRSMRSPENLESVQLRTVIVDKEDLNAEAEILTSMEVVQTAIKNLRQRGEAYDDKHLSDEDIESIAGTIRDSLKTVILPNSNIISAKLYGKDPGRTQAILNEIMTNYVKRRRDVFNPKGVEDFFVNQVKQYNDDLEQEELRLVKLAQESGSANAKQEISNNLTLKMELKRLLFTAHREWNEKNEFLAQIRNVLAGEGIQFYSFIENLSITHLGDQLQQLIVERGGLLRIYHQDSKQLHRIDEQVAALAQTLRLEVTSYADSIESKLSMLKQQIANLRGDIKTLEEKNLTLYKGQLNWERAQRERGLMTQTLKTFSQRLEEARIGSGTDIANLFSISILSRPRLPSSPTYPKANKVIPLGLISGFILGCCLGFITEYFDHTFKRPEDAERYTGIPTLFSIPQHDKH